MLGTAAEQVDVDHGHQPEREERRPRQAAHHRQEQRHDQDEHLGDEEQLDVLDQRRQELGQRSPRTPRR